MAKILHDEERVVAGSDDGKLYVWRRSTGELLRIESTTAGWIMGVTDMGRADRDRVATVGGEGRIQIWDLSRDASEPVPVHSGPVTDISVSPDGSAVLSMSETGPPVLSELSTGRVSHFPLQSDRWITASMFIGPSLFVAGYGEGGIGLWSVAERCALSASEPDGVPVERLAIGHDGESVVAAKTYKGQVAGVRTSFSYECWRVDPLQKMSTGGTGITDQLNAVCSRVLPPHRFEREPHSYLVFAGNNHAMLHLGPEYRREMVIYRSEGGRGASIVNKGHSLVFGSHSGSLEILNLDYIREEGFRGALEWPKVREEATRLVRVHTGAVTCLAACEEREYFVTGSEDNRLIAWDDVSCEPLASYTLDVPVTAVAMSADGRLVVAGDKSGRVHFLEAVGCRREERKCAVDT